jgi:hypothetical protein
MVIVKKDYTIKPFIRYRKRELRTTFFKLSNFRGSIFIFLLSTILFGISYVCKCNSWLSSALLSVSCGCFTGLVLYFLSNLRNNKLAIIQKEHNQLKEVIDILNSITATTGCYKYRILLFEKRDIFTDCADVFLMLNELEISRNKLPLKLYGILPQKGYDPADMDNLNDYRDRLSNSENKVSIKKSLLYIYDELLPLANHLQELYLERDEQLMLMGKCFL